MTLNGKAKFCLVILLSSSKIVCNWGAATYAANVDYDYVTIFTDGQSAVQAISRHLAQSCTVFSAVKELNRLSLDKHICHFRAGFGLRGKNRTTTFPTYLYILSPCEGSLGVGGWKLVNLDTQRVTKCKNKLEICLSYFFPSSQTQAKNALCGLRRPQMKKVASSDPN